MCRKKEKESAFNTRLENIRPQTASNKSQCQQTTSPRLT